MITTGNRDKTPLWIGLSALLILSMVLIIPASAINTYIDSVPYEDTIEVHELNSYTDTFGAGGADADYKLEYLCYVDGPTLGGLQYLGLWSNDQPKNMTVPTQISASVPVTIRNPSFEDIGSGTLSYYWLKNYLGVTIYTRYDLTIDSLNASGLASGAGRVILKYSMNDFNGVEANFNTFSGTVGGMEGNGYFACFGANAAPYNTYYASNSRNILLNHQTDFEHTISIDDTTVEIQKNGYTSYHEIGSGSLVISSQLASEDVDPTIYITPLYVDIFGTSSGEWYNYTYTPAAGGEAGQPYIRFRALDQSTYGLLDGATMGILKNSTGAYNEYTMDGGIKYLYVDTNEWYQINCTMAGYVEDNYNIMFTSASTDAVFYLAPTGGAAAGSWQVNFYVYDDDTGAWLNQAVVTLYEGTTLLDTEITNAAGYATADIVNGTTLTYKATKSGYLSGTGTIVVTSDREVYIPCISESSLPTATATGTTTISDPGELSDASRTSARSALAYAAVYAPQLFLLLLVMITISALKKV